MFEKIFKFINSYINLLNPYSVILLRIDIFVKCAIMNTKQKIMKTARKQKQHYVDNQEFLAAIVEYK